MKKVEITSTFVGICHMQVCVARDATDEEILEVCNRENPSGTTNGWSQVVREDEERPQMEPVQCQDDPNRIHLLVAC